MRVVIQYCCGKRETLTSDHNTGDKMEALSRAIRKHFGAGHSFYRNRELCTADTLYGQIGHVLKHQQCSTMDTGRVSVRFE